MALMTKHNIVYYEAPVRLLLLILICSLVLVKKFYFYRWSNDKIYLYKDFGAGENAPTGDLVSMHTNGNAIEMGFAFSDGHFYICNITKNIIDKIARGDIDPLTDNSIEIQHYSGFRQNCSLGIQVWKIS